ncbi:MAG: M67 family metallopeptidase [Planctomycetota bacterium]|jgi:proteasome lid subunit RPN8/RPN11
MSPTPLSRAWITADALRVILDAQREAEDAEPCGLLFGRIDAPAARIRQAVALENVHETPDRAFAISDEAQLAAIEDARARGFELVGVWHGHLVGDVRPGRADREMLLAGRLHKDTGGGRIAALVIAGRGAGPTPVVRAFVLGPLGAREIPLRT